jgi:hypothetical protein
MTPKGIHRLIEEWRNNAELDMIYAYLHWIPLGVITSVLTNPIWVIKTRMLSTGSHAPGAYASSPRLDW